MSDIIYPTFLGLAPNFSRLPVWKTQTHASVSGREVRGTYRFYPLIDFTLVYEFLRDGASGNEFAQLVGFYNARGGSWDSFLFTDPADSVVTLQGFGAGDGVSTAFQLTRAFGAGGFSGVEPVMNLNGAPLIYVGGVLKTVTTDYTVSATGVVTFASAPAIDALLTWSGAYYYRCRFVDDTLEFTGIMSGFWEVKKVLMRGSLQNVL